MHVFHHYNDEDRTPHDLSHVRLDSSMEVIRANTFMMQFHLIAVELHEGLRIIRSCAFFNCGALTCINIPSTVITIGESAFSGCSTLQKLVLPDRLESIGKGAFSFCKSFTHFRVPTLTRKNLIESTTFQFCSNLYSVELPPTLERIDSKAFEGCSQLRNVLLSSSVNQIALNAFDKCTHFHESLQQSYRDGSIIEGLRGRFDDYPLHKLCYYQSYFDSFDSLREELGHAIDESTSGESPRHQRDAWGMSPLHILAQSAKPNLDLCKFLLDNSNGDMLEYRDIWGRDPLMYSSMHVAPQSTEMTKLLLGVRLSERLQSLGLPRWRMEVESQIEGLQHFRTSRSDRIKDMGNMLAKLAQMELKESSSLLELAVWKAKIDDGSSNVDSSEQDSKVSRVDDRARCRMTCGSEVIVANAIPFLFNFEP